MSVTYRQEVEDRCMLDLMKAHQLQGMTYPVGAKAGASKGPGAGAGATHAAHHIKHECMLAQIRTIHIVHTTKLFLVKYNKTHRGQCCLMT